MSSQLSPSFIIPVGTQVVLKRDHPVVGDARTASGERVFKKAGSAGEIRSAPTTHDNAYVIHFADGHQVHARRDDLTLLRTHAPERSLIGRFSHSPHRSNGKRPPTGPSLLTTAKRTPTTFAGGNSKSSSAWR